MKGDREGIELADQLLAKGVLHPETHVPAQNSQPGLQTGPGQLQTDQSAHDHREGAGSGAKTQLVEEIFHDEGVYRTERSQNQCKADDPGQGTEIRPDELKRPLGELKTVSWHRGRDG